MDELIDMNKLTGSEDLANKIFLWLLWIEGGISRRVALDVA